jgi:spermidine/putrescine transport system substrate-binding protein
MALVASACGSSSSSGTSAAGASSGVPSSGAIEKTLHYYNWAQYTNPANQKEFSKKYGVHIIESNYTSNEQLLTQLNATKGQSVYDIIVPDADHVNIEKGLGLLLPLNHDLIPNLKNLDPHWTTLSYDPGNKYSVIKDTGITTFARRSDNVPQNLTSWTEFFDFLPQTGNLNVNFIESPSEVIGVALIAKGHSMNTDDDGELSDAQDLLMKVRPYVDTINEVYVDDFISGKIDLGITYSGDALRVQAGRKGKNDIAIALPDKSEIWIDNWAISASASDPYAAHAWINYILEPEPNAREMEYNAYEVGTPKSFPLVQPQSLTTSPLVVFDNDVLTNYEVLRTTPVGLQKREAIWSQFKAG